MRRLPQLREPGTEHRRRLQRNSQTAHLRPGDTDQVHPQSPGGQARGRDATPEREQGYGRPDCRLRPQPENPEGGAPMIRFESQRVSLWYIRLALVLFCLQVTMGLWLSINYAFTLPQWLVDVFAFNTARSIHTNLLVAWMLLGFMGGTYFILPLECDRELYSTRIAYLQLIIFAGAAVTAVVGFLFRWTKGKPLLEIPFPLNALIVVAALLFIANVAMTIFKAREKSALQWMLLGGVTFLALLYLFGMPFFKNLNTDYYYWWWVIHLWVEGAWEIVTAAIMAFIIMEVTGVERKVVEKWLYVETGLLHRRHRPPLLLARRSRLLALVGRDIQRPGAPAHRAHGGGYLDACAGKEEPDHQSAHLDLHRRTCHLSPGRRGSLGIHAHPAAGQLLYPRQPGHRLPRSPGLLRRL